VASGLQTSLDRTEALSVAGIMHTTGHSERRAHRRLTIELPLQCARTGLSAPRAYRTVTRNVSSGGLYFESDSDEFRCGMLLELELTVPPGDGHFPYPVRVRALGEVVRIDELPAEEPAPEAPPRFGIATRLRDPFQFAYQSDH